METSDSENEWVLVKSPPSRAQPKRDSDESRIDPAAETFGYWLVAQCIVVCLAGIYLNSCSLTHRRVPTDWYFPTLLCYPIGVLLYSCYLYQCWHSATHAYLCNKKTLKQTLKQLDNIRKAAPVVTFRFQCSHDETYTVQHPNHYDSPHFTNPFPHLSTNMNTFTTRHKRRVKTHTGARVFPYAHWRDESGSVETAFSHVTKVHLEETLECLDGDTTKAMEEAAMKFRNKNRHLDQYMDFWQTVDIPHFTSHILSVSPDAPDPWWLNLWCYWLLSLCLLSWVYLLAFEGCTSQVRVRVRKLISIHPDGLAELPSPGDVPKAITDAAPQGKHCSTCTCACAATAPSKKGRGRPKEQGGR